MESIAKEIKTEVPDVKVIVGGVPIMQDFTDRIGVDAYSMSGSCS